MKTISIKLFLLFVIVISCKSNKTLSGNSNIKEQAIETCLNDFIKSEKLESNTVYEIIKNNESKNLYCFWILITKNKLFVQER
jgi:hypothetical protein